MFDPHRIVTQQVAYIPALLPNSSHLYLEIISALCTLSGDDILSELAQDEIKKRCHDTPDVLPLLKFYKSSLPPNIIGYFLRLKRIFAFVVFTFCPVIDMCFAVLQVE